MCFIKLFLLWYSDETLSFRWVTNNFSFGVNIIDPKMLNDTIFRESTDDDIRPSQIRMDQFLRLEMIASNTFVLVVSLRPIRSNCEISTKFTWIEVSNSCRYCCINDLRLEMKSVVSESHHYAIEAYRRNC